MPGQRKGKAEIASRLFWWQQGRSDASEGLQVQVLELRKAVLGEKHPGTILAMANLASTWWQQGRSDAAEELEAQAFALTKHDRESRRGRAVRRSSLGSI